VQIVLLTLLVSFVTSIATGIVTVSLMDQAPPAVEQTVNRIVERTIQTVAPSGQASAAAAATVTQEKTVIVKETDLISQAVTKVSPSIVRLYSSDAESPAFLGLGIVLDKSGTIVTDTAALGESSDAVAELSGGLRVRTFVGARNTASGLAYMRSATTSVDAKVPSWTPITLSADHPTLGATVVALSGNTVARIVDGIITAIQPGSATAPSVIDTSLAAASLLDGSPLVSAQGALVGVSTKASRASSESGFMPAASISTSPFTPTPAH
jgi:hypothetical protein